MTAEHGNTPDIARYELVSPEVIHQVAHESTTRLAALFEVPLLGVTALQETPRFPHGRKRADREDYIEADDHEIEIAGRPRYLPLRYNLKQKAERNAETGVTSIKMTSNLDLHAYPIQGRISHTKGSLERVTLEVVDFFAGDGTPLQPREGDTSIRFNKAPNGARSIMSSNPDDPLVLTNGHLDSLRHMAIAGLFMPEPTS